MGQDSQVQQDSRISFEPSDLVEYGDARELTLGAGAPSAQVDGATYNS